MSPARVPVVRPGDEARHRARPDAGWREVWRFDVVTDDASTGATVRLALHPDRALASYRVLLFGEGRPLIALVDEEVPLPRPAGGLEIRSIGLWADHVCERGLEHWGVGVEAFALEVDPTTEVGSDALGERVPLGLDVEWEADGAPDIAVPGHYEVPARVSGEVLVGRDRTALDGWGRWVHRWGPTRRAPASWGELRARDPRGSWLSGPVVDPAHRPPREPLRVGDGVGSLTARPVAWAALRLVRPGGVLVRWERRLLRMEAAEAPAGAGWIDLGVVTG